MRVEGGGEKKVNFKKIESGLFNVIWKRKKKLNQYQNISHGLKTKWLFEREESFLTDHQL